MDYRDNAYPESIEMYLESIDILQGAEKFVRQVDIANLMRYSRPTVHITINKLAELGLVEIGEKKGVKLTEKGRLIAQEVSERHRFFACFLSYIGVDEKIAQRDACKIEHDISPETFDRLKDFCKSHLKLEC
ncbi:MAG: metal-dependent transcriptional regulator [Anaerolineaceae bacterium]|nr:metal-dependent transcriptional regulator [Anaerolineaceae bacterium]